MPNQSDEVRFDPTHKLCRCGTVEDARQAAEKLFVDMRRHDCPVWVLQVSTILRTLCLEEVVARRPSDVTEKEARQHIASQTVNPLVRYQREHGTPPLKLTTGMKG